MQKLAAMIPGAQFSVIENAGHYAWAEQPEAFNRVLLDFLKVRMREAA
jgi:pimeloyl-ACP methyl ester carboxylesterase